MSWLTPDLLERAYEMNRAMLPFRRMKLPDPDSIMFKVSAHSDRYGHFRATTDTSRDFHEISISSVLVTNPYTLLEVMAHEMIHLAQEVAGTASRQGQHNAEFWDLVAEVERRNRMRDVM